ncbi:MAG: response regulator [Candidatus Brocadiales bacterium]
MVLLVEDAMSGSERLKSALEARNLEVLHTTNGMDALALTREKRPHLVVLNTMTQKMNGYQLCRLLKFDSRFSHIPVIIISSRTGEADRELGMACGGNEYISKPYDVNKLIGVIEGYLGSSN